MPFHVVIHCKENLSSWLLNDELNSSLTSILIIRFSNFNYYKYKCEIIFTNELYIYLTP